MNSQALRLGVAAANLCLIGAIGLLGWNLFRPQPQPKGEWEVFDPLSIEIRTAEIQRRRIDDYALVWQALEHAAPPPAPETPLKPKDPEPIRPQNVFPYTVITVGFDCDDPSLSSVLLSRQGGGDPHHVQVGGRLPDGWTLETLEHSGVNYVLKFKATNGTIQLVSFSVEGK